MEIFTYMARFVDTLYQEGSNVASIIVIILTFTYIIFLPAIVAHMTFRLLAIKIEKFFNSLILGFGTALALSGIFGTYYLITRTSHLTTGLIYGLSGAVILVIVAWCLILKINYNVNIIKGIFSLLIYLILIVAITLGVLKIAAPIIAKTIIEKPIIERLKNNAAEPVDQKIIDELISANKPTLIEGANFPYLIYSWQTKYGRIYADKCDGPPYDFALTENNDKQCFIGCIDGGTDFYDAMGQYILNCGSNWGQAYPYICDTFFKKLKASDADYYAEQCQ